MHIRGGDEEDLRQVVFHVEIVIHEHEVLFRIEHFQQRRGRVAAEVHRHLVDFVQHEDRILGAGLLHHLDDLARQCADVGAAMAANFSFIAHAAQRHANKLAAGGLGDRHSQRRLADSRRSNEAEDRALGILHQLAHREILEDALLDLFQPEVIFVQDLLGAARYRGFPSIAFSRARPAASRDSCAKPWIRLTSAAWLRASSVPAWPSLSLRRACRRLRSSSSARRIRSSRRGQVPSGWL